MEPQTADDSNAFRHLFVLSTPSHDPGNRSQYVGLRLASTLRHRIEAYPDAPHGFYVVDDDRAEGELEVLAFFQGSDILKALQDLREARKTVEQSDIPAEGPQNVSTQKALTSSAGGLRPEIRFSQGASNKRTTSHAQLPSSSLPRLATGTASPSTHPILPNLPPQSLSTRSALAFATVTPTDRNTLMPLSQVRDDVRDASLTGSIYALEIEMDPALEHGASGSTYKLPIDTAAPSLWFFQKDCQRLLERSVRGQLTQEQQEADGDHDTDLDIDASTTNIGEASDGGDNTSDSEYIYEYEDWPPQLYRHIGTKKTLLPGAENATAEGPVKYADGGVAWLRRYPRGNEIMARIPSWGWESQLGARTVLPLPRVLAFAVNDVIAKQPFQGNLGLTVPGATDPFDRHHPSTFFEAIKNEQHVDKPTHMTLRLLHPEVVSGHCPDSVRSFLYYGEYWPCHIDGLGGMPGQAQVPTFTPKLWVVPTEVTQTTTSGHATTEVRMFRWWAPRLCSISLLVPKRARADMESPVPWRDGMEHWEKRTIDMPTLNFSNYIPLQENSGTVVGIPVILDTCSTESVLPDTVLRRIAEEWLGFTFADSDYQDIPDMVDTPPSTDSDTDSNSNSNSDQGETAASGSDMDADQGEAAASGFDMDIYCPDWLDLDDHDILFTFLGQDLNPVEFRCTASRFLRSVWREPRQRGSEILIRGAAVSEEDGQWILGQNFFWTAFVRLDCSFTGSLPVEGEGTHVNIRLAPQRSKDAEGNVAEETSIRFHNLPGRTQELETAGLKYDD